MWLKCGLWWLGVCLSVTTFALEQRSFHGASGEFEAAFESLADIEGVRRYRVSFPSPYVSEYPENNTVVGELYIPKKHSLNHVQQQVIPVVLLHILNGNYEVERLIALELAKAGAPAFWFKLPFYGERRPREMSTSRPITPQRLFQLLDQGNADFTRACDMMISAFAPEANKVNVVGISMGGILAYDFANNESRVQRICSVMAGGDLWGIIHHARETRQLKQAFAELGPEDLQQARDSLLKRDPLTAASQLRSKGEAGDILMINARLDEVIPERHAVQLAEALGIGDNLVWMEHVGHYTIVSRIDEVVDRIRGFFVGEREEATPSHTELVGARIEKSAEELLGGFLFQIGTMLDPISTLPTSGEDFRFRYNWMDKQGAENHGVVDWRRSLDDRFILSVQSEQWGDFTVGQSTVPWMFRKQDNLLIMGEEKQQFHALLGGLREPVRLKLQLLANVLKFGARVPGILQEQGELSLRSDQGIQHVRFVSKKSPFVIEIQYDSETDQYQSCVIEFSGHRLKIDVESMASHVQFSENQFEIPTDLKIRPVRVRSADMQHTLSFFLEILNARLDAALR